MANFHSTRSLLNKRSITLYLGVLTVHLLALLLLGSIPVALTKVALMPLLWGLCKLAQKRLPTGWTIAILFSWIGDILLLPVWVAEVFFFAGMGAFLVAQLSYCRLLLKKGARLSLLSILLVASIVFAVEWGLATTSADLVLRIGIGVYGACLLSMLFLSLSLKPANKRQKRLSSYVQWGAALFVMSDSLIALRMFVIPEGYGTAMSIAVMFTYGLAQLGLAWLLTLPDQEPA